MKLLKYSSQLRQVVLPLVGMNTQAININFQKISQELSKGMAHKPLKGRGSLGQPKWHNLIGKSALFNGIYNLIGGYGYFIISKEVIKKSIHETHSENTARGCERKRKAKARLAGWPGFPSMQSVGPSGFGGLEAWLQIEGCDFLAGAASSMKDQEEPSGGKVQTV